MTAILPWPGGVARQPTAASASYFNPSSGSTDPVPGIRGGASVTESTPPGRES